MSIFDKMIEWVAGANVASVAKQQSGYTGTLPSYKLKKSNAEVKNDAIIWAKKIAKSKNFHYGKGKHAHHNGCYYCGTQPKSKKNAGIKKWEKTYCCNPFVHAAYAHGGCVPEMLSLCQKGKSYGFSTTEGYAKSSLFKKVSLKDIKKGDVLCSDGHVALYIGSGKVIHAGNEDDNVIGSKLWIKSIGVGKWKGYKRAYRYIGSVDKNMCIRHGEYSKRVKQLQEFLNWWGNFGLSVSGLFNDKTYKAVKEFQKSVSLEADGVVGEKTISTMKKFKQNDNISTVASVTTKRTPQDKICAWAEMVADSKKFKYVKWKGSDKKTQTCPICQKRVTMKVDYDESKNKFTLKSFKINDKHAIGGNCLWAAFSPWKHGAGIPIKCSCHTIASDTGNRMYKAKTVADALKIAQQSVGIKDLKVIRNKKGIPTSEMKKGDVLLHFSGGSYRHATLYVGNGKLHDATGGRNPNIKYGTKLSGWYKNNPPKILVRYEGK